MVMLEHEAGRAIVDEHADGTRQVRVEMKEASAFVQSRQCRTSYDIPLIALILDVKGPAWLCDEIMRDEDPGYVQRSLEAGILGYVTRERFDQSRILDFGCGSGASTVALGRMVSAREIVGLDLGADNLRIAQARLDFHGMSHVRLLLSPSPRDLPPNIGRFDFVLLSAVLEHLLPTERRSLLPTLWRLLEPGGVLFISETPSRWLPIETHTTGLPLINYLPRRVALGYARRAAKCIEPTASWEDLLRGGVRGSSLQEILGIISAETGESPQVLPPNVESLHGPIGVWLAGHHDKSLRAWQKAALRSLQVLAALPPKLQWQLAPAILPNLRLALERSPI